MYRDAGPARYRVRARWFVVGVGALLQSVVLISGLANMAVKPGTMPWQEEAMLHAPIIVVPLISLAAFGFPSRPRDPSLCAQCGYELTGLPGPVCPECGQHD